MIKGRLYILCYNMELNDINAHSQKKKKKIIDINANDPTM